MNEPTLGDLLDRAADLFRQGGDPTYLWCLAGHLRESQVKPGWAYCPACGAAFDCGE